MLFNVFDGESVSGEVHGLESRTAGHHITRYIGATLPQNYRLEDGSIRACSGDIGILTATSASTIPAHMVAVDSDSYTGYENAIYAANKNTVFVAYKRFLQKPYNSEGEYIPAELRVAKSIDGGRTWEVRIVDSDAIEQGDLIDKSVSIDGDHGSTIYVAYLVQRSGYFSDMYLKVAKSMDGGVTWTNQTVTQYAGQYNSIQVLNKNTVLISTSGEGEKAGLHVFRTSNGGRTWFDSLIDSIGWYTGIDSTGPKQIYVSYYKPSYPSDTDLYAAKFLASSQTWSTGLVEGYPDNVYTGLGSSIAVSRSGPVYISYEDFRPLEGFSIIKVAKSKDGGASWSVIQIDQDVYIGVNTSINVIGTMTLFISYWYVDNSTDRGQAKLAKSIDGGAAWFLMTLPETRYVSPYLDSVAPNRRVQYVSYQTIEDTVMGEGHVLRVARISTLYRK